MGTTIFWSGSNTYLFGIGGIWSAIAPIDGAVHASGEVIVSSNRKIVQHLGGGIISKILVKESQAVKKMSL